jgi:hypothetical protein
MFSERVRVPERELAEGAAGTGFTPFVVALSLRKARPFASVWVDGCGSLAISAKNGGECEQGGVPAARYLPSSGASATESGVSFLLSAWVTISSATSCSPAELSLVPFRRTNGLGPRDARCALGGFGAILGFRSTIALVTFASCLRGPQTVSCCSASSCLARYVQPHPLHTHAC